MTKAILRAFFLMMFTVAAAHAQTVGPSPHPDDAAPSAGAPTPAEAQRALNVLRDPDKSAQLIDTLQTVAKASAAASAPPKPVRHAPDSQLSLQPDSLGAQLVVQAAGWAEDFSDEIVATARAVTDLPLLWRGVVNLSSDSAARAAALDAAWRAALVLACAFAIEALFGYALRRPLAALEVSRPNPGEPVQRPANEAPAEPASPTIEDSAPSEDIASSPTPSRDADNWRLVRRLPLALLRLALSLLPVGGFAAAGAVLMVTEIGSSDTTRLVILEALKAYVLCRTIICVARMLVSPSNRRLRLLHIADETAAYIEVWARRIAVVTVLGGTFAEAAQLLSWNQHIHNAVVKLVVLIDVLFLTTIVLQCRVALADRIRAGEGERESLAALRNRLADTWHYIAIFVIATLWLFWAVKLQDGLSRSLQFILISVAVLIVARLAAILALGLLGRMFHINRDLAQRFPGLEQRANRYYPLLRGVIGVVIGWITLIALFETWGFDALAWFGSDAIGGRLVSAVATIGIAVATAAAVWEGANAGMERHLARLAREARYARSARLRTLLPILRSSLLIVILTIVGLTVLSEIGVNIAPLLAGAGIIGIAIGFGSQKLVQDLITGLFLLLENAMQVGDWVTVSGLSGSVENLSIRTIRLRAGDGSIHIVPFSSVTSVTNSNRGIGNAAISVSVAYDEDTDQVGQALKQIALEMRKETRFKTTMRDDLQLWGVDKVDGASVTIVGQIVCTDSGRWDVQREFNRRMKQRFQELGIVIATPNQSIMIQQVRRSPILGSGLDEASPDPTPAPPSGQGAEALDQRSAPERPISARLRRG